MSKLSNTFQPAESWQSRHRGPFRLVVIRPGKKPGAVACQWLKGQVSSSDAHADALALLSDPRDTILTVDVWSLHEEQFVMTYRPADAAAVRRAA